MLRFRVALATIVFLIAATPVHSHNLGLVYLHPLEQVLLEDINSERLAADLQPLAVESRLVDIARVRSADMVIAGYFSHWRPDGSLAFQELLSASDVSYALAGEVIARNNYPDGESPAVAVAAWLASPAHRDILLDAAYSQIGLGVVADGAGLKYYTAVLVAPAW